MPPLAPPRIRRALPLIWGSCALLALFAAWLGSRGPEAVPRSAESPGFDRRTFLTQARELAPPGRLRAQRYADEVSAIEAMPQGLRARAQEASSFNLRTFGYAADIDNWGVEDYWAAPLELADKGSGDCEDFAFSAYEMLAASGTPARLLRMAYALIDQDGRARAHMVLLAMDGPHAWVVDNTREEVLDLADRPDLRVLLSFDSSFLYLQAASAPRGSSQRRIGRWRGLLAKAAAEGFAHPMPRFPLEKQAGPASPAPPPER